MSIVIWIVLGVIVLAALSGSKGKGNKPAGSKGHPFRIDHPHVISDDESECSVCGKRLRGESSVCPSCGTQFACCKEDYGEFDEEEDELEAWDEEEGL